MAPFWLLGAFVVWCGVSALVVGRPQLISGWVALVFAAALAWAVAALVPRINLARLQAALFASAGAVSLFGLYQFIGGAAGLSPALTGLRGAYTSAVFGFPRVQATALEPLYFANYLLIPLIIGLAMWALSPRRFPVWQRTVVLLAGLDFVLTMSRGAFIALAASLVLGSAYVLLKKQSLLTKIFNWRFLAASIIIIALGLGLVGAASWLSTGNFNRGPLQYIDFVTASLTKTASFTERAQMRQQAIDIWHAHPVLGVGIEGIGPYVHNYPAARTADDTVALNNQFLELLAESGIVGAALFYGFLAWLLIRAAIQLRDLRARHQVWLLGTAVALVALTIQAQSFSGFLLTHLWVVYGLLAGLTAHGSDQAPVREINSEI
jgi:O-antigen ligase